MNLTVPHSWLQDFLATKAAPEKIAAALSLCGPSVESVTKTGPDYLYHLEVTSNRVDMFSVNGIAREAAAILPQFGFKATLKNDLYQPTRTVPVGSNESFPLKVIVDQKLCARFSAVIINNVTVKPSPEKIKNRLELSGIRSLNNVVDISNYLMRSYGQPVHVFDFDKIKDSMTLRLSKSKESLTTLDHKTSPLPGGDIVIEDGRRRLIDLCGIMGGLNSAVDDKTKNVLLFVQTYSPSHIRKTSMSLSQRTEAAQIFEKSPDPELVLPVLSRGIQLFKQLTGGKQASQIIDIYPQPYQPKSIKAPLQLIKDRLGVSIRPEKIKKILQLLGFKCQGEFLITVPSWRSQDVNLPEDIIEEVARIYGYRRLPSRLMATSIPTNYPDDNFGLEYQLKLYLAAMGLNEIYTNSMISARLAQDSTLPLDSHLKIKNALSTDWQYLRRSLIPSHLQAWQQSSPNTVGFFELANTYQPRSKSLPEESLELIISSQKDYLTVKGIVEVLFDRLYLTAQFEPVSQAPTEFISGQTATIKHQQINLGIIGPAKLNPQITIAVVKFKTLIKLARPYPQYQPVSMHPPVIEDLTFTLAEKTYLGAVIDTIKARHRYVQKVHLSKTFRQNFTFTVTYQSETGSLSDKLIAPIRKKIVQSLKQKFRAQLVGKLD